MSPLGVFTRESSTEGKAVKYAIDYINKNDLYPLANATLLPIFQAPDKYSPYITSYQGKLALSKIFIWYTILR